MSKIDFNSVQIGGDNTATKNFTFQSNTDGTMKLARGNAGATTQDILTVDATGAVIGNMGVGAGQTWQNLTASRAVESTYTNTAGRPIALSIVIMLTNTSTYTQLQVGGVTVDETQGTSGGLYAYKLQAIVPAGAAYKVTGGSPGLRSWMELR
jgi:hypothetical protein